MGAILLKNEGKKTLLHDEEVSRRYQTNWKNGDIKDKTCRNV